MKRKSIFAAISLIAVSATIMTSVIHATADNKAEEPLGYDGAPIVIVEEENDLPEAMRRNIEIVKNKPDKRLEQEQAYQNWLAHQDVANGSESTYAILRPSLDIYQNTQETFYNCGYASLQSILEYHGIEKTQTQIASEAYYTTEPLAWFTGVESAALNLNYYPASVYLNSLLDHTFQPYNLYFGSYTASFLANKVKYNIDQIQEPVMIGGTSWGDDRNGSRLPNYPESKKIDHWIVVDGYHWDNVAQSMTNISFVDPAATCAALDWGDNVSKYSYTDVERMYKFSLGRGIVY